MESPAGIYSPKRLMVLLLILLAFAIPMFVTSRFYLHILIMCFIWGMAASSMNLIMGYTGQVNLAPRRLFRHRGLRRRFAHTEIRAEFLAGSDPGLHDHRGLRVLHRHPGASDQGLLLCHRDHVLQRDRNRNHRQLGRADRRGPGAFGNSPARAHPASFRRTDHFYLHALLLLLVLISLLLTLLVIYRIVHSMMGRSFMAIRGNEELAESIGIHAMRTKLLSFLISTVFAGLAVFSMLPTSVF